MGAALDRNERDRLESLRSYQILDTEPEREFDIVAALAARACGMAMGFIGFVDAERVWFKARHGAPLPLLKREGSASDKVVTSARPLLIEDVATDPTRGARLLAAGARSYAGVPLIGRDGLPVGVLCVADTRPRSLSKAEVDVLEVLAETIMTQLELRRCDVLLGRIPAPRAATADAAPRELRRALDDRELVPYFQPLVDLHTGQDVGFEALLRWHHPTRGVLSPAAFLTQIETSRLVLPVGRHVLHESLRLLADLRALHVGRSLQMAVNVSTVQLDEPAFAGLVLDELEAHLVPPPMLSLEITETAALIDSAVALSNLHALRDAGVHLALDDYGTGLSSVMRLLALPVSELKIDMSLTRWIVHDHRSLGVARNTIAMASDLGLGVVAEGVETSAQREVLVQLGCRLGQGHLFGHAMPREQVVERVTARERCDSEVSTLLAAASSVPARRGRHLATVYGARDPLPELGGRVLADGLRRGAAAFLVADGRTLAALGEAAADAGVDVQQARRRGSWAELPVEAFEERYVPAGRFEREQFLADMAALLGTFLADHAEVLIYGGGATHLWRLGLVAEAIALEDLCNDLAARTNVTILCTYPEGLLDEVGTEQQRQRLLDQHALYP